MRKFLVFAMVAVALTIFNGCQKEEQVRQLADAQPQAEVRNLMFAGLDTIDFSVEDNRLVFDNEQEYQKCIDFLAQLGDENFPAFEKEIGFDSYRKLNESNLDVDNLFATLINPEGVFQVNNFLLKIDFVKKKSYAFLLTESEKELKSALIIGNDQNPIELSWEDDGFAILNEENQLKRAHYCTINKNLTKEWTFDHGPYSNQPPVNPYTRITIKAKMAYQHYTFYHSLVYKIKSDRFSSSTQAKFSIWMESIGNVSWHIRRCTKKSKSVNLSGILQSQGAGLSDRPFATGRRVRQYHAKIKYTWRYDFGAVTPDEIGDTGTITFMMDCDND